MHYIEAHGLTCTPRELFQEDILSAIGCWIEHGDRILIFIDKNEHIHTGHLAKAFQHLGLLEATHLKWKGSEPQTFVFGKGKPINGMYHSPELEITSIMQFSFHKGVGDHKTTLVDVTTRSVIGKLEKRVVTPQARKLSTKNKKIIKEYIQYTTQQCRLHKLQRRLDNLTVTALPGAELPTHQEEMERLDTQKTKIQSGGEQRCRKIRQPPQLFSPQIREIDLRRRAYVNMEAWHKGDKKSNGNVFRAVARAGISRPKTLTAEECTAGAAACQKLIKENTSKVSHLRREHLHTRYELALDLEKSAKCIKIKEIIKREEQQDEWHRIKRAPGDPRTGATNLVQCKEGEKVINILKASAMNAEIQRVTEKRLELANSALIQHSLLRQLVGFCPLTTYAKELLQGKLAILTDIDEATTELIQEMQQLWMRIWPFHGQTKIMSEVYKYYWGGVNKSTSLALSKIHFGHWNAWQLSLELTKVACSQLNLIALAGGPPSRWGNGLQVLLENVPGVALVDKLWAILLMEGDFNFFNKWLFGHVVVNKLYKLGYIPEDQYSKKSSTAEDSKLDNRLSHNGSILPIPPTADRGISQRRQMLQLNKPHHHVTPTLGNWRGGQTHKCNVPANQADEIFPTHWPRGLRHIYGQPTKWQLPARPMSR